VLLVAGAYGALVGELQANKAKIEGLERRVTRQEQVLSRLDAAINNIAADVKVIKAILKNWEK